MPVFEQFPYTNFHEMNLDWIISRVRDIYNKQIKLDDDVDTRIKKVETSVSMVRDELDNFIADLNVREEVYAKLDEMLADGTLSEIVNTAFNRYAVELKCNLLRSETPQNIAIVKMGAANVLVDTGKLEDAPAHAAEMRTLGYSHIDYVIITHYHEDHAEGLTGLMANGIDFQNCTFILPPIPDFTKVTTRVQAAYNQTQTNIQNVGGVQIIGSVEGQRVWVNQETGLYIDLYNVEQSAYYNLIPFDYNNCSMVAVTGCDNGSVCWTGDISLAAQEHIANIIPHCDIMQVEHHGYNSWVYEPYILKISPKYAFTMNGFGDGGNNRLYLLTNSKTQALLQRLAIPNYATSDNGSIAFTFNRRLVTTAKMFSGRMDYNGCTSVINAINYDAFGYSNDITLFDLIKGMAHGTFMQTKVTSDSAIFKGFSNLFDPDVTSVMFLIYKNASAEYTAESSYNEGFILMTPVSGTSKNTSFVYATYQTDKDYSSISITFKPLVPNYPFKFNISNGNFTSTNKTSSLIMSADGSEVTSKVYGYLNFIIAIENSGASGTVRLKKNGNTMARINVGSGEVTGFSGNAVECTNGDVFTVEHSEGATFSGRFYGYLDSRYTAPLVFTDTKTTAPVFYNQYPTY